MPQGQKLNDYKAILLDVDKTLTNSQRQISPRTQAALHKLTDAGYIVALCTGRSYSSLYRTVLPLFPAQVSHITCGGAQIIDGQGTILWESLIPAESVQEIVTFGLRHDQLFFIPVGQHAYATPQMITTYLGLHPLVPEMKPISQIPQWAAPIIPMVEVSQIYLDFLHQRDDVTLKQFVSFRGGVSADATAPGVTKAAGIVEWTKLVGIRSTEIIGFGDSDNDVEFLEVVGHAVAMGNATDAIKNICDRVIGHTDEDGLAIYLEQLLEGAEL